MRQIIFCFLILFSASAFSQRDKSVQYDLAYYSDSLGTCVIEFASKQIKRIPNINDACISPDGTRLAYVVNINDSETSYIIDLNTLNKTKLNIMADRLGDPLWSPNGDYIIYNVHQHLKDKWQIGLLETKTNESTFFGINLDLNCPSWTLDSKTIIAQDLHYVYKFDLKGNIKDKISIESLGPTQAISSDARFLISSDGQYLIWPGGTHEYYPGAKGPDEAIFIYNFQSKIRKQLTPNGLVVCDLFINSHDEIFFTGYVNGTRQRNIYKINLKDKTPTLLIKNSAYPTSRYK